MSEKTTEAKRQKKCKRLKGVPLGKLRAAMKKLDKKTAELTKFRQDWVDQSDYFKDQVEWKTCLIYDADVKTVGKEEREAIGRIPKDIQRRQTEILREIQEIDDEVGDVREEVALIVGVNPNAIDPATGYITMETDDFVFEDVDGVTPRVPAKTEETPKKDSEILDLE